MKDFEYFLMEKHLELYVGQKEEMINAFPEWLEGLTIDEWLIYGEEYKRTK